MIDNEILLFISIYINNFHLLHILSKYFLQFSKTYNELNYVNRNLWNNYFVSMIFSIIISYQSILHTYFNNSNNINQYNNKQGHILAYAISYFIYDLIYNNVLDKPDKKIFNIHHTIAIIGISATLYYKICCNYIIWFLIVEASTPFLNIRWFLLKSKFNNNHYLVKLASLSFFISYTLARVIQMPIIQFHFVVNYNLNNNTKIFFYIENILFYILYTMNLYWYLIIINKAFKIKKD